MLKHWLFMLILVLLIPVVMIIWGKSYSVKAPENINSSFGYRSKRSKKNKDTWEFAHKHIGKTWFRLGLILLLPSALAMLPCLNTDIDTISTYGGMIALIQLLILLISMFPTERALKRTFDDQGNRIS